MRSQWCREHIDKTAEECGLEKSVVSDVKQAAKFCAVVSDLSECSTRSILALIRIKDEPVKNRAISLAINTLKEETPTGGQKRDRLTEKEIKKLIDRAEREVRGELAKKYRQEKKPSYNGTPQPGDYPAPPAPMAQTLKEKYGGSDLLHKIGSITESSKSVTHPAPVKESLTTPNPSNSMGLESLTTPNPCGEACPDCPDPCKSFTCDDLKKAGIITDTTGQVSPSSDIPPCKEGKPCPVGRNYLIIQPTLGNKCEQTGRLIRDMTVCPIRVRQAKAEELGFGPASDYDPLTGGKLIKHPPYKITKAPEVISFTPSQKQYDFIQRVIKSGEFETAVEFLSELVDRAMEQEGS